MKGKTDPMERQVIIMYTLTIKQINFSFVLNVRAHKCLCRGGCFTDKFLLSNISDEIHDHMKHERIQQFLLYNYKKLWFLFMILHLLENRIVITNLNKITGYGKCLRKIDISILVTYISLH